MDEKSLAIAGSRKRKYWDIKGDGDRRTKSKCKEQSLQKAIEGGDLNSVSAILQPNFNQPWLLEGSIINRGLITACLVGNEAMVSKLLMSGASVNEVQDDGMTPLKAAIMSDCFDVVEFLLLCGAKLELSAGGENHLHVALKAGFTSDSVIGYDKWDPALMTYTDIVKLLIDNSTPASVNRSCFAGYLPLSLAASSNRDAIVKALLKRGASVNAMDDKYGMTPLMHAAVAGNIYIVNLLLKHGAITDHTNCWGYTPLMLASQMNRLQAAVSLLRSGSDPNVVSFSDGKTALILATEGECLEIMVTLLSHGADVNYRKPIYYRAGSTALMVASKLGLLSAVRLLLEHGADVDQTDDDGNTALTLSSCLEILELLTNVGIGHTPKLEFI